MKFDPNDELGGLKVPPGYIAVPRHEAQVGDRAWYVSSQFCLDGFPQSPPGWLVGYDQLARVRDAAIRAGTRPDILVVMRKSGGGAAELHRRLLELRRQLDEAIANYHAS